MPEIICTECGNAAEFESIRRAADEFCAHCDFPLFWAKSAVPAAVGSEMSDATLRRLPGTGGRRLLSGRDCPSCGELNSLGETHCTRCTNMLDPEPVKDPLVVAAPPPPPVPEPEPVRSLWWAWALGALVLLSAIGAALWWLFEESAVL